MKRRTTPIKRSGVSSYKRHNKRPCDYSAMYARCTHLRRPSSSDKEGSYNPHVANPFYRSQVHRTPSVSEFVEWGMAA